MAVIHCVAPNKRQRSRLIANCCTILRCPCALLSRCCCSPMLVFKAICFVLFSSLLTLTVGSFVLAVYTAVRSSHYPYDYEDRASGEYDLSRDAHFLGSPLHRRFAVRERPEENEDELESAQPYGDTEEGGGSEDVPSSGGPLKPVLEALPSPAVLNTTSAPSSSPTLAPTSATPAAGMEWWTVQLRRLRPEFASEADRSRKLCQRRSRVRRNVLGDLRFTSLTANGVHCAVHPLFLLVLVHSKAAHGDRRNLIRATFGSMDNLRGRKVRLLFGLGQVDPSETTLKAELEEEARQHGDLVQGNFREHNRNLTHNFFVLLRWIGYHCPHVEYIAKLDDDTFLDVGHLLDFLEYMPRRNFVYCAVARNRAPVRYGWSKWFVSRADYPQRKFPNYCLGVGFVISGDVTPKMLGCALASKLIPVDDVFYTGQVLKALGQGHSAFWEGHTYAWLTPRLLRASDRKNFIFLASKQSVVMPMLWKKLWKEALLESLNSWSLH